MSKNFQFSSNSVCFGRNYQEKSVHAVCFVRASNPQNDWVTGRRIAMGKIQRLWQVFCERDVLALGAHPTISDRILQKIKGNGNKIIIKAFGEVMASYLNLKQLQHFWETFTKAFSSWGTLQRWLSSKTDDPCALYSSYLQVSEILLPQVQDLYSYPPQQNQYIPSRWL